MQSSTSDEKNMISTAHYLAIFLLCIYVFLSIKLFFRYLLLYQIFVFTCGVLCHVTDE